jgi:predicted metal-dependent phosphoesterase TrpH
MPRIKVQLHLHTKQDPLDSISYTEQQAIDTAAKLGYQAMAITCHNVVIFNEDLKKYAADKRILLIPGIEKTIAGKHVLILNADVRAQKITTFDQLRTYRKAKKDLLIVAPHPYYPDSNSLGKQLEKNIDLFDAIEYSWFHSKRINRFNQRAIKTAEKYNLPVLGTSDCHIIKYFDSTFSLIDTSKTDTASIFEAIKKGKVSFASRDIKPFQMLTAYLSMVIKQLIKTFVGH